MYKSCVAEKVCYQGCGCVSVIYRGCFQQSDAPNMCVCIRERKECVMYSWYEECEWALWSQRSAEGARWSTEEVRELSSSFSLYCNLFLPPPLAPFLPRSLTLSLFRLPVGWVMAKRFQYNCKVGLWSPMVKHQCKKKSQSSCSRVHTSATQSQKQ